jgi:hypothetical protein
MTDILDRLQLAIDLTPPDSPAEVRQALADAAGEINYLRGVLRAQAASAERKLDRRGLGADDPL